MEHLNQSQPNHQQTHPVGEIASLQQVGRQLQSRWLPCKHGPKLRTDNEWVGRTPCVHWPSMKVARKVVMFFTFPWTVFGGLTFDLSFRRDMEHMWTVVVELYWILIVRQGKRLKDAFLALAGARYFTSSDMIINVFVVTEYLGHFHC